MEVLRRKRAYHYGRRRRESQGLRIYTELREKAGPGGRDLQSRCGAEGQSLRESNAGVIRGVFQGESLGDENAGRVVQKFVPGTSPVRSFLLGVLRQRERRADELRYG